MGKKVRLIIMAAALLVFLGSGGAVLAIQGNYRASRQGYTDAAAEYTQKQEKSRGTNSSASAAIGETSEEILEQPPITVDFERLRADNPQVVAWLYCEDTAIDYPVMQGSDNEFYLHHSYTGAEDQSGAIFVDAQCTPGFADYNSIIYGHSMKDGSMFGGLESWKSQEYYEEHPVMWLLTPEANYRIKLFSGYTTSAYSETYTIFREPGEDFAAYIAESQTNSDFTPAEISEAGGRYVVLSTCAYDFDEARYVLHGRLEQVDMQ
ncbi:MAG: class B sortase [Acutalibacter sp.]|jgi:sortase B|uniref:class B sortase n=1 Tax=Acutalibacter sp. TaxID=1918636 RepID=UPI00217414B8|nr:class B sortase [Acutalibacter sp.]MCI9224754.1 class B sortase [Acutalibacter sp.]